MDKGKQRGRDRRKGIGIKERGMRAIKERGNG